VQCPQAPRLPALSGLPGLPGLPSFLLLLQPLPALLPVPLPEQ